MKFLFATLFISSSLFAQVDYEAKRKAAVLKIVNLTDSRIELDACGTNEGTNGFHNPSTTTVINCSGKIVGTKRLVLIFKNKTSFSYFEVSNCGEDNGYIDQASAQFTTKCEVRSLVTKTLKVVGPKRTITYFTAWEYSVGYTRFKFKNDSINYDGVLVGFSQLMEDRDF